MDRVMRKYILSYQVQHKSNAKNESKESEICSKYMPRLE